MKMMKKTATKKTASNRKVKISDSNFDIVIERVDRALALVDDYLELLRTDIESGIRSGQASIVRSAEFHEMLKQGLSFMMQQAAKQDLFRKESMASFHEAGKKMFPSSKKGEAR